MDNSETHPEYREMPNWIFLLLIGPPLVLSAIAIGIGIFNTYFKGHP